MAIPPISGSLTPIPTLREDLLEIARNVYVAPSGPDASPAPSSGLLADLSSGEARGPNRAARFLAAAAGPATLPDRFDAEAAPAPSLIGLRAPRIATMAPMPEAAEPRRQDSEAPAPRGSTGLPVFPRAAAIDLAPTPVETPSDAPRNARVEGASVPASADPTSLADVAGDQRPATMPNMARTATPIPAASDSAPALIEAGMAGEAESTITGTAHARREAVQSQRDTTPSDATALAPGQRLSQPSGDPESGRIVDGPIPGRDPVENGARAGERASSHPGAGGSAANRAPDTAPVSDPTPALGRAAFEGGQMERAGIIASCILNAAMIPGWPPPRAFAVPNAEDLSVRLGQIGAVPTEADILAFLKRHGRRPSRLARLRQMLAKLTKSRRLRTFLGLAALMATIESVLEAVEAELGLLGRSGEDSDEPGADEERRRHLRL